ncbi:MAG TPA: hypothetical protein VI320_13525 [Terracidiphilus sp.]
MNLEATMGQRPSHPPDGLLHLHRNVTVRTVSGFVHGNRHLLEFLDLLLMAFVERVDGRP